MCDNHFYAVCVTTGHDASKAQEFFDIVDEQFRADIFSGSGVLQ